MGYAFSETRYPRMESYIGIGGAEVYQLMELTPGAVQEYFAPYSVQLEGAAAKFTMIPIKGGEYLMGSPDDEMGRNIDEGPQVKVQVGDLWMAETEIINEVFDEWIMWHGGGSRIVKGETIARTNVADAVSGPSQPYTDMTFGMGRDGRPAILMTHLAARTFTMWLSAKTGHFYRLPTEGEWEYACRAGSTTAFYNGTDTNKLDEIAWYEVNSDWSNQPVKKKRPNAWGLYDMIGGVWEWCLDGYTTTRSEIYTNKSPHNPMHAVQTNSFPHVVRGGSWDDVPARCRSAARMASTPEWSRQDPGIPISGWYHTSSLTVGFRVIRPRIVPPIEDIPFYWPEPVKQPIRRYRSKQ